MLPVLVGHVLRRQIPQGTSCGHLCLGVLEQLGQERHRSSFGNRRLKPESTLILLATKGVSLFTVCFVTLVKMDQIDL